MRTFFLRRNEANGEIRVDPEASKESSSFAVKVKVKEEGVHGYI